VTPEGELDALFDRAGISGPELADVLALIAGTDIAELDVSVGATRLSLKRSAVATAPDATAAAAAAPTEKPSALAIASPQVGIFRCAVSAGERVAAGQSLGAVEALGMPTSVQALQSGIVETLLVQDGSPVEYGQPLLVLRRG
jgi:acetyl-CoA carboxylase biotin carboxyl carrier protein